MEEPKNRKYSEPEFDEDEHAFIESDIESDKQDDNE